MILHFSGAVVKETPKPSLSLSLNPIFFFILLYPICRKRGRGRQAIKLKIEGRERRKFRLIYLPITLQYTHCYISRFITNIYSCPIPF